jgi:L-lactate dehydrogenase complex protein LldG
LTSREEILGAARAALHRQKGDPVPAPPPVILSAGPRDKLVEQFTAALEKLAGKVVLVDSWDEAWLAVHKALNQRTFVASPKMGGAGFSREAIAFTDAGVTSADYGLADTGSLVIFTESNESRLLSLLPPCHIAVIERSKIVPSLDDVYRLRPLPGAESSAMVVITGPSRTADIEMRLVRGVHGPGEIHVIVVDDVTHSAEKASHKI